MLIFHEDYSGADTTTLVMTLWLSELGDGCSGKVGPTPHSPVKPLAPDT